MRRIILVSQLLLQLIQLGQLKQLLLKRTQQAIILVTTATATSSPSTNGITYSASGLPAGVSMNATGTISGSPTMTGDYDVTVTAKDKMDSTKSISATYNFSVTTPAATNPTWSAQAAFAETYTTSDNISTTATATSSPSCKWNKLYCLQVYQQV